MRKLLLFFSFFVFIPCIRAQAPDLSVTIGEPVINNIIKVIGPINGSNEYKTMLVKGTYYWTMLDAKIKLEEKKALFVTNVKVEAGGISYTDDVEGEIAVRYNQLTNKLELKLTTAIFEIYTRFLGTKISLKKIDLADYFKDPFLFDGPMAYQSVMPFTMPDNTVKNIAAKIKKCDIAVVPSKIIMNAYIDFIEVKPNPK